MPKTTKKTSSAVDQLKRFKAAAASVETDDSEDRFDKVLKHVAKRTDDERKVIEAVDATAYERNRGRK